jgi:hypothetical protein
MGLVQRLPADIQSIVKKQLLKRISDIRSMSPWRGRPPYPGGQFARRRARFGPRA